MATVPSTPPPDSDAEGVHDVLDEVLLLLIESGCQWVRTHPEVKLKLRTKRPRNADFIAVMLDPDSREDER